MSPGEEKWRLTKQTQSTDGRRDEGPMDEKIKQMSAERGQIESDHDRDDDNDDDDGGMVNG